MFICVAVPLTLSCNFCTLHTRFHDKYVRNCLIQPDKIVALTSAAGVEFEPIWASLLAKALEGKNVKDLLSNVGAGGAAPAAGAPAAAAGGAAAADAPAAEEKKEEEKEESDDDMVRLTPITRNVLASNTPLRASVSSINLPSRRIWCRSAMFSVSSAFVAAVLHALGSAEAPRYTLAYRLVFPTSLLRTQKDCENSTLCICMRRMQENAPRQLEWILMY